MQKSDFKAFAQLMTATAETLGYPKLSVMGLELFFRVLESYSFEEVKAALANHIKTSPYMPKPADIIGQLEGTAKDKAAEAWACVVKAIRDHGSYASVKFDDPAIHYAIDRMGGWIKLCMMTHDEEPFRAKDFQEHYTRAQGISWDLVPRYFAGLHEINNRSKSSLEIPEHCKAYTGQEVIEVQTQNTMRKMLRDRNLYITAGGELDAK